MNSALQWLSGAGFSATALGRFFWSSLALALVYGIDPGPLRYLLATHSIFALLILVSGPLRARGLLPAPGPRTDQMLGYLRSCMDIFLVSLLCLFTGGIQSPLVAGLAIPIGLSSLTDKKGRGIFAATLAAFLLFGGEAAVTLGWPDTNFWGGPTPTPWALWAPLAVFWLAGMNVLSYVLNRIHGRAMKARLEAENERSRADAAREEADRERLNTEKLNEFARALNDDPDLDRVIEKIIRFTQKQYSIDSCILFLPDPETGELVFSRYFTDTEQDLERIRFVERIRVPPGENGGILRLAFERQKPLHIRVGGKRDIFSRPYPGMELDRTIVNTLSFRWFLLLPLVIQGQPTGLLTVTSYARPEGLSRQETAAVERFGEQIAGAINTSNLLKKIKEEQIQAELARQETEILAELSRRVNESTEPEQLLQLVAALLGERYGINNAGLWAVDGSGKNLMARVGFVEGKMVHASQFPPEVTSIPLVQASGSMFQTFSRRKPSFMARIPQRILERFPVDRRIREIWQFDWFLQLPLLVNDKIVGIVAFGGSGSVRIERREIAFCEQIAAQIAGGFRAAELLRQAEESRRAAESERKRAENLNEFSRALNASADLYQVVDLVFSHLSSDYEVESSVLLLPDGRTGELLSARARAPAQLFERASGLRIVRGEEGGIIRRVYERKKPLLVHAGGKHDVFRSPYPGMEHDRALIQDLELQWFMLLPLVVQGKSIGILLCTSYMGEFPGRRQIESMAAFANQIAGAIHVSNLFTEVRKAQERAEQAREDTQILADLARKANSVLDLEGLLRELGQVLDRRFGASAVAFFTVNASANDLLLAAFLKEGELRDVVSVPESIQRIPLVPESGTLFRTFQKRNPFYLRRVSADWLRKSPIDETIYNELRFQWCVELPLLLDGQVVAILTISGSENPRRAADELHFLERMGAQVAGAVRALELLRQTRLARAEADRERDAAQIARSQAEKARAESDKLLYNVLPGPVAEELKREGRVEPLFYDNVTVLFTDFVGFTRASEKMMPHQLVEELDGCFSQFDEVARRFNMEKLKTIGDSYMCVTGVPHLTPTHAVDACLTALEFRSFMLQMAEVKRALGLDYWQIRIGIHSGPVTGGVIGNYKFAYDIWGDTVNVASRMESAGEAEKINISAATYELVKDFFICEYRGKVQAKGKGVLDMYFLLRIKPELSADDEGLLPNGAFEIKRLGVGQFDGLIDPAVPVEFPVKVNHEGW
ncbi:MAG: GAF domain-containing protein [Spirochaetales bacterium]|nr:GAF domain-containing protein [Spirochaetales bacterium]